MNFSFQMIATDVNGVMATTQPNYAMTLNTDQWYRVYADFGNIFDSGFNPKRISKIGLQSNYLGSGLETTFCQIDTIRITE
jgi:hypothetical protein